MSARVPSLIFLLCILGWSGVFAQSGSDDSSLLYARATEGQCSIGVWRSVDGEIGERLRIGACPEILFMSADGSSAFVVDAASILSFATLSDAAFDEYPLPDLAYDRWASAADVVMHPRNLDLLGSTGMQVAGIGRLDDGSLAVHLTLNGPADDSVNYLLRRGGGQWELLEGRLCGRWEFPCTFDSLQYRSSDAWLWPASRQILSSALVGNPYVTGAPVSIAEPGTDDLSGETRRLSFRIDGKHVELIFDTTPSAHFDHDYTMAIDLAIDGNHVANLSRHQCMTSLHGRYLLVQEFFGGRYEVTDLGTGETVIDGLSGAIWLD